MLAGLCHWPVLSGAGRGSFQCSKWMQAISAARQSGQYTVGTD